MNTDLFGNPIQSIDKFIKVLNKKNNMEKLDFNSKILFGDLHLHLGGAIQPRILWHRIKEIEKNHDLLEKFTDYDDFEKFFTAKKKDCQHI